MIRKDQEPPVASSKRAGQTTAVETALPNPGVAEAVTAYFAAINKGDRDLWLDLFAEGSAVHDPVGAPPVEGQAALVELWNGIVGPFDTLRVEPSSPHFGGAGAAAGWQASGKGVNGRHVSFEGITVFEISDEGKIQALMAYWDPATMIMELAGDEPTDPDG